MRSAPDKSPAAILASPKSGAFDDIGALVTALRSMLDGAAPPTAAETRHLYVLAVMAETAWRELDDAMTGKTQ